MKILKYVLSSFEVINKLMINLKWLNIYKEEFKNFTLKAMIVDLNLENIDTKLAVLIMKSISLKHVKVLRIRLD